jgi:hypothetical protein
MSDDRRAVLEPPSSEAWSRRTALVVALGIAPALLSLAGLLLGDTTGGWSLWVCAVIAAAVAVAAGLHGRINRRWTPLLAVAGAVAYSMWALPMLVLILVVVVLLGGNPV